jgi:type I restriction enzyme S subunit
LQHKLRLNSRWINLPLFDHKDWPQVLFGDVVQNVNETERDPKKGGIDRFIGLEHLEPGFLHIRTWGSVVDGITFTRRCRPGQVLFGKRRAYQRKVGVADFDAVVSSDIYVFAPKNDKLLPELLPFLCMSERFCQHAVETSAGSLSPRTNWRKLMLFEFKLPPLDQQRRIAEILWAVDECLFTNDNLVNALHEYRQSLLDSIAHEYASIHALVSLESAIDPGRPICYGILKPGLGIPNGIPVIKVRDFPDGHIHAVDLLRTTPEIEAPFKRSRLRTDDLLISIRGTVGRLAEVPASLDGANITQDTARLSIAQEHNRKYIRALLESRFVQNQITSRVTGLAVKGINIGELRKIQIPLPPRPKQDAIAEQLGEISKAQTAASNMSKQQRGLMASMREILLGDNQ